MSPADMIALAGVVVSAILASHALRVSKQVAAKAERDSAENALAIGEITQLRTAAHRIRSFLPRENLFKFDEASGQLECQNIIGTAKSELRYSDRVTDILCEEGLVFVGAQKARVAHHIQRLVDIDNSDLLELNVDGDWGTTFPKRVRKFIRVQSENCEALADLLVQRSFDLEAKIRLRSDGS